MVRDAPSLCLSPALFGGFDVPFLRAFQVLLQDRAHALFVSFGQLQHASRVALGRAFAEQFNSAAWIYREPPAAHHVISTQIGVGCELSLVDRKLKETGGLLFVYVPSQALFITKAEQVNSVLI